MGTTRNRWTKMVDNKKNQNYLRFYDLVYGYSALELRQNSGLGRSKEKMVLPEQKPWMDKNRLKGKTRQNEPH